MNDTLRESLSYFGIYAKLFQVKKIFKPEMVSYGESKEQYFLYYEPLSPVSDKIILWVHGGGWNSGSPKYFDFVGQCAASAGYRFVSVGYRHSPENKYPCQIEDVAHGYKKALEYLSGKGIDMSKIVVSGPSAGAHLTSILCYSEKVQRKYDVDVSGVIGFVGSGGPYSFDVEQGFALKTLLNQLFEKDYDRRLGEPCALMSESHIPALIIQSRHDGLIDYACAERFCDKARSLGIDCELYSVTDKKNTHSWYTAGMFLETRAENKGLDKFFSWIEALR